MSQGCPKDFKGGSSMAHRRYVPPERKHPWGANSNERLVPLAERIEALLRVVSAESVPQMSTLADAMRKGGDVILKQFEKSNPRLLRTARPARATRGEDHAAGESSMP